MSVQRDRELDELFENEPELRQLAQLMRARPHPAADVEPSPHFRVLLKQRLMREAWERVSQPPLPWHRRLLAPQPLAWAGAAIGALLIVFAAWSFATTPTPHSTVKVSSTLNGNTILLSFNQPMDTSSVQHAVQIVPATEVARYEWEDNKHLAVRPLHDLTPNTQYQVTIAPTARTQDGQPVSHAAPVQFVTSPPPPTPTPTPTSTPTSTPPPPMISGLHDLAPIGAPAARWSPDGAKVYIVGPTGQLGAWPLQGGASTSIQPDGVTLVAVASDGTVAYARDGQITYGSVSVPGVQPIALGFAQSGLIFATASDVEASDQHKLATFTEQATTADFSPAGDRLVYRTASGNLHLVDLSGRGKDSTIGPSAGMGDWSPDGTKYAYPTDAGISAADTSSGSSSRLLDLQGLTGLSWSHGNQLLLSTSSALYLYTPGDAAGARKVAADQFDKPSWAPSTGGYFSFRRGTDLWVAKVSGVQAGIGPPATASSMQDDVVNGFMAARQNQQADQAASYLDASGKEAFNSGGLTLTYAGSGQSLARYYVLLSQPNRVVVRLVLAKGTSQSAVDETLTLKISGGKLLIDGVSARPRNSFGAGPEVVKVIVASDRVQVFFDSDLDPSSVPGSVSIQGANGQAVSTQATYDPKAKAVSLPVAGLSSGATYSLSVGGSLKDTPNGRQAVPYDLQFVGP